MVLSGHDTLVLQFRKVIFLGDPLFLGVRRGFADFHPDPEGVRDKPPKRGVKTTDIYFREGVRRGRIAHVVALDDGCEILVSEF